MGTLSLIWGIIFILAGLYLLVYGLVLGAIVGALWLVIPGIIILSIGGTLVRKYDSDRKKEKKLDSENDDKSTEHGTAYWEPK